MPRSTSARHRRSRPVRHVWNRPLANPGPILGRPIIEQVDAVLIGQLHKIPSAPDLLSLVSHILRKGNELTVYLPELRKLTRLEQLCPYSA